MPAEVPEHFWRTVDSFIDVANRHCESLPRSRVSATLLYAAARFNSFTAASQTASEAELVAQHEAIVRYYVDQYEKMLRENLRDHASKFDALFPENA